MRLNYIYSLGPVFCITNTFYLYHSLSTCHDFFPQIIYSPLCIHYFLIFILSLICLSSKLPITKYQSVQERVVERKNSSLSTFTQEVSQLLPFQRNSGCLNILGVLLCLSLVCQYWKCQGFSTVSAQLHYLVPSSHRFPLFLFMSLYAYWILVTVLERLPSV